MVLFKCDFCGKETDEALVTLNGIIGNTDRILLPAPERFHRKHFCCPACFWEWVFKNHPVVPLKVQ